MLDEKKIKESMKRVEQMLKRNEIIKEKDGKFTEFFLDNAVRSFEAAKLLYDTSTKQEIKKMAGFPDFNGFLWVINASYYSMFYAARALLEKSGVKIKADQQSIHLAVFDALIYYFYSNSKIERRLIEEFKEASVEASEILGKEKAKELMDDYLREKEKRGRFTYEMGEIAMQSKAGTSLDRSRRFNEFIREMLI